MLALLGRPVPGLWQLIERRGERWYLKYCMNKGVPAIEAQDFLLAEKNQILLAKSVKEASEANGGGDKID